MPRDDDGVSPDEEVDEERRRQRRAGDPRITPEGRELLRRLTNGDLQDELKAALNAVSDSNPSFSGSHDSEAD